MSNVGQHLKEAGIAYEKQKDGLHILLEFLKGFQNFKKETFILFEVYFSLEKLVEQRKKLVFVFKFLAFLNKL